MADVEAKANGSGYPESVTYEYPGMAWTLSSTKPEEYWEAALANFLYAGPSILLLIIGSIGNVLSFLVFNKKSMKKSVTSVYFRVLAITDTTVLYSGCIVNFATGAFGKDARLYADGLCKFFVTLLKVTCYNSCWILVLISIDRFIGVYMPHKYRQFCTKRRAVISMVIVLIVMMSFVGGFWGTALIINNNRCGIAQNHLAFFDGVYQWLDLLVLNLVPSIILVSTNVAIIRKISKGSFGDEENSGSTNNKTKKKGNNLTVILLSISLVYILCTIPTSTAFLVIRTFHGPRRESQVLLYLRSCETLYYANHASNFFLYCIHGTSFRKELKGLFCKEEKMVSSTSNSTNMSAYTISQTDQNS